MNLSLARGLRTRIFLAAPALLAASTFLATTATASYGEDPAAPKPAQDPAAAKVEEQVVGPAKQGNSYVVSPKGLRLATVAQKGSRYVVLIDGVEGPKFDDILSLESGYKVLFSPDGARFAYVARSGDDFVLMVDGKELMRPGNAQGGYGTPVSQLAFTSNSKHLWFLQVVRKPLDKGGGSYPCVVWDGVQEIPGGVTPVISPDGEHHVYTATNPEDPKRQTVMLDGKPSGYAGNEPQFTGDSQHVIVRTYTQGPGGAQAVQLLLDGKPWVKAQEATAHPAPVGDLVATVVHRTGKDGVTQCFLVVAGKKIDGSECAAIDRVTFSPDGKRYAAECRTAASANFVVVDGQRGQEYSNIVGVAFSPDSSRYTYVGMMNGKTFVIVDGEESDGLLTAQDFTFGGGGKRLAYLAQTEPSSKFLVLDGKPSATKSQAFTEMSFDADGTHFAYLAASSNAMHVFYDGAENPDLSARPYQPWPGGKAASMVLSRDGKHVAAFATSAANTLSPGLWVDGKEVQSTSPTTNLLEPTFTPDGKHLFWTVHDGRSGTSTIYADGAACAQFGGGFLLPTAPPTWDVAEDGVLTVLVQDGEKMKRFRITPSPAAGLETLLATAAKPAK